MYYGDMPPWQANIRAIAKTLEHLRDLDRWGVTKRGEQYTGWKALPATASTFADVMAAADWMRRYATLELHLGTIAEPGTTAGWKDLYRIQTSWLHA